MRLKVINSNSFGNAYILENKDEALLIECGVRFDKIKQAISFNLSKIKGCILTHEHGDHAKSIDDVLRAGIRVYASEGTHNACKTSSHHRSVVVKNRQQFQVGSFKVRSFDVKHDVAEPLGFLINHVETGNVLFLTDSYYCEYTFRNLHNVIIEANYAQDIVDRRMATGGTIKMLRDRVLESHMSIDTCIKTLKENDMSQVNKIILIHLSDGNSDEARFVREVQDSTGKYVKAAVAGMEIDFNKTEF